MLNVSTITSEYDTIATIVVLHIYGYVYSLIPTSHGL